MIKATTDLSVTHTAYAKVLRTNWKQLCFRCLMPSGGTQLVDQVYEKLETRKRAVLEDKKGQMVIQVIET